MMEKNYKVLIVDDIEENLRIVGNILGEQGIAILFAKNGEQALKIAYKKKPDLILMDINMPKMNGYEACAKLKKDNTTKEIPVIFLSALSEKDDIVVGFDYGAVDYITKPFNKFELLSRVFTHLELKYSKDHINKQNIKLQELNDTKDMFFSIIAHDLKNPFNSLINFSELLFNKYNYFDDKTKLNYIKSIHNASKSGYKLLENLLEWSRLQTGTMKFAPTNIEIDRLIQANMQLVKGMAQNKEISMEYNNTKSCFVLADYNMIDTVVRNLISNALKFTNKGGTVSLFTYQEGDNSIIKVADSGVGISDKHLNCLFMVDKKVSTVGTNDEKGTGLGLILCKEFVEKNGGTISCKSEEGVGSEFIVSIPCLKNEKSKQPTTDYFDEAQQELLVSKEFVLILKNKILPQTDQLLLLMSIKKFKTFASELTLLAAEHKVQSLLNFSIAMSAGVNAFDFTIIQDLMDKLRGIVAVYESKVS